MLIANNLVVLEVRGEEAARAGGLLTVVKHVIAMH
jgi:hypothetical protein